MTKEQAIDIIKCLAWHARPDEEQIEQAIKSLEQQSEDCKIFGAKENCFGGADCENCDYKIQPLMQPTSDDCVSRAEVIDELNRLGRNAFKDDTDYDNFFAFVDSVPPVTPKIPTSDDCVSRQAILDGVKSMSNANPSYWITCDVVDREDLIDGIQSLPPITPTQSWIPVSERLPEDRNIVLVTAYWHETYQVMMGSYFGEGLWWCVPFNNCGDLQKLNPKAWQPLPVPYKEKRGNENEVN